MTNERFKFGRLEAKPDRVFPDRIFVEFMAEGDEEQHFDMTVEEARAFRDWLNGRLSATEPKAPQFLSMTFDSPVTLNGVEIPAGTVYWLSEKRRGES